MKTIILILVLFFARIASAQVFISEIMYDPKGTDASAGGEWIEVQNNSPIAIDLTTWFFFENNTNHGITADGAPEVPPGEYAVISKDTTAFKNYFTSFTRPLFKASFSLVDSEEIAMKSGNKSSDPIIDSVLYNSDQGAKNDGNSLQKVDGAWKVATPTPGASNSLTQSTPDASVGTQNDQGVTPTNPSFPVEPQIFADAGASVRTVSSGAPIVFTGRTFGLKKEPIENARMIWSFGDGGRGEGMSVAHTYYYPGDYVVVLDVASGYYSASDRATVRVSAPLVALSVGGDQTRSFVTLENSGVDEIDLSDWQISSSGKIFIFPKNTILSSRKTLTLASEVTGLVTPVGSIAELLFPNGSRVSVKSVDKKELIVSETLPRKVEEEPKIKPTAQIRPAQTTPLDQKASIADAFSDTQTSLPTQKGDSTWYWYIGVAFLSAFALLSVRLTRGSEDKTSITVDDFEIVEEVEDNEPR